MSDGWICLHRKITEWEWYSDLSAFRLFMHILLKANHTDSMWRGVSIMRGQFITSREKISQQTGLTIKQIRSAETKLVNGGSLVQKGANKFTIYTIVKYDEYQDDGKQRANKGQTKGKQRATNNNDNNNNNEDINPEDEFLPQDLWKALLDMRKAKKVPNTDRALSILKSKLREMHSRGVDIRKVLEKSIVSGWPSVYEEKQKYEKAAQTKSNVGMV